MERHEIDMFDESGKLLEKREQVTVTIIVELAVVAEVTLVVVLGVFSSNLY